MSFINWVELCRYEISHILITQPQVNTTRFAITLKHVREVHKPLTITVRLGNSDNHLLYGYYLDFNGQTLGTSETETLVKDCEDLARGILKESWNGVL